MAAANRSATMATDARSSGPSAVRLSMLSTPRNRSPARSGTTISLLTSGLARTKSGSVATSGSSTGVLVRMTLPMIPCGRDTSNTGVS